MEKMLSYNYYDKHDCRLERKKLPQIEENEILVNVKSCGVCGTDIHIDEGNFKAREGITLGHEFAGVVEKVGKKVKYFKKGDTVIGDPMTPCFRCEYCKSGQVNYCVELPGIGVNKDGAFAEYIKVPESNIYKFDNISFNEAAFAEPLSCCIRGMDQLEAKNGENIVIIGDGPIGLLFVQLAKLEGLSDIVLVGSKDRRKELGEQFGINKFIYGKEEGVVDQIKNYFNGKQINNIVEAVGKKSTINIALNSGTYGSRILLFGVPDPDLTIDVSPSEIFEKELKIMGSLMNPYTIGRAKNLLENKLINVNKLITHTYNLENIEEAFKEFKENRNKIKIMIEV